MPEVSAGGVALLDYDGDGRLDILQIRHPPPGPMTAGTTNRMFRQQPDGTFRDVTREAHLDAVGYWQGVAVGDADNDGFPDVYVTAWGRDRFFHNNGDGTFTDRTDAAGFSGEHWSTSAAFLDYDRDGWLDLVVAHFGEFDPGRVCRDSAGRRDYCGPREFRGAPVTLYHNNGDGTFTDVTAKAGIDKPGRGWGVACADFTGDGWPDVYVANDQEPAHLWVNQHDGTFRDEALERGCALSGLGLAESGMGIAVGDVANNGLLDLLVTHVAGEKNTLYLCSPATGPGRFDDRSAASGMAAVDLPFTGWGVGFFDFDNDGNLDVAVANGRVKRGPVDPSAALGPFWNAYAEKNLLFRGDGAGRFADVTRRAGDFTRRAEAHHGLAFGDLDNDGAIDLVETTADNTLHVYHNQAPAAGAHWLTVRAMTGKRDAAGAAVTLTAGGRRFMRLADPGYSYASSNDSRAHFGLGPIDRAEKLEVAWPDGRREAFPPPALDRQVTVHEGEGAPAAAASR